MSPFPPKLAPTLRLLRHPSQWKSLERFISRASFVSIHDCGDVTIFNDAEYWMDPRTGMPRSKMTKTGAFARYFFPEEAKRIEDLRKRNLATKKALATAEKLASEVRAQGEMDAQEQKAKADAAEMMVNAEIKQSSERDTATEEAAGTIEPETAEQAGVHGTEGVKKQGEGDAAGAAKTTRQMHARNFA